jgi:putative PIG3 family NAD(P)H quinone oxidoreductase
MKAIVISQFGGPEVLQLKEVETPHPARGEVRVRVRATAVNRADLLQRMGLYPAPPDAPAEIPGLEFAGEVDAVGENVDLSIGDRVFGLCGGGSYAEYLIAHSRTLARIPEGMSFTDAAAIPEAFITAWDAMVTQANLRAGETVLIQAAGSGVGTAAIQIARAIGARSVGTTRSAGKLERAKSLGLDEVVVSESGKFAARVLDAVGPVDVILELVGGGYVAEDLGCLAPRGRIVVVGLMAGIRTELDLNVLLRKRAQIMGTVLRSRPLEEKILATQEFSRHVVPLLGRMKPVIDKIFPLERAAEAHAYVASNEGFGKVVLQGT